MQNGDMSREMSQEKKTLCMYVCMERSVNGGEMLQTHRLWGKKQLFSVLEFYLAPTNIN